jgi:pimeloyl-ACP methyl ester carboxylesterase
MERPHIVGVSAGAQAAIDYALNFPDAVGSLLLGASPLAGFDMGKEFMDGMMGVVTAGAADDLQLLHDRVWAFAPFRVAATMPEVRRWLNEMIVHQNTWAGQQPGAPRPKRPQTPPATRLSEITAPTLVVVGDTEMASMRNEADFLVRSIRGAKLIVIEAAGHFPNLEQPRRFNEILLNWLETQASRTESR